MASGFGYRIPGNWCGITSKTGLKICAYYTQSINYDNRSVTITGRVAPAMYRIDGGWNVPSGQLVASGYSISNFMAVHLGSEGYYVTSPNGDVRWNASINFYANTGGNYLTWDGYAWGSGEAGTEQSISGTYWYDVQGNAIKVWTRWAGRINGVDFGEALDLWTDSIPPAYTAPSVSNVSNLEGNGNPNKACSKIFNPSNWGTNSIKGWFEIWNNNSSTAVASSAEDNPSIIWNLYASSTSASSCSINVWHGRTINNHSLYSESGNMYIATPSAPTLSYGGELGTDPTLLFGSIIKYRGGTQNSSSCDNGDMKKYQYGVMTSDQTGVPSTLYNYSSTSKTFTASITKDKFTAGKNYKLYVRAINYYGGTSYTTSPIIYCPTGVYGNLQSKTSTSLTIKAGANSAGAIGSSAGGTLACYQLKWGDAPDNLTNTLSIQDTDTFTIDNLSPNQTVYYQITAWNIYGLNAVSNVTSQSTIPRYNPEIGTITKSYNTAATTYEELATTLDITINHTGGLTIDELPVTSITVEKKNMRFSSWQTVRTDDNLDLAAGDTYTFANALTGLQPSAGDWELKITVSNGTDSASTIIPIYAPTFIRHNVTVPTGEFIQIQADVVVSTNGGADIWKYKLCQDYYHPLTDKLSSSTSVLIKSPKILEFDTRYPSVSTYCYNLAGVCRESAHTAVTTPRRFNFYGAKDGAMKKGTELLVHNGIEKDISEVYYVKKGALGNVQIGDNLKRRPLHFITQPLHLHSQAETEARITFSNGKYISCDKTDYGVKFGYYNSNGTAIKVFFEDKSDGTSAWTTAEYVMPNSDLIVDSITSDNDMGLNVCPAFSTTSLLPATREPEVVWQYTIPAQQVAYATYIYVTLKYYNDYHATADFYVQSQNSGSYAQNFPVVIFAGPTGGHYNITYLGNRTTLIYSSEFAAQPGQTYNFVLYAQNTSTYPNYRFNASVQFPIISGGN